MTSTTAAPTKATHAVYEYLAGGKLGRKSVAVASCEAEATVEADHLERERFPRRYVIRKLADI